MRPVVYIIIDPHAGLDTTRGARALEEDSLVQWYEGAGDVSS